MQELIFNEHDMSLTWANIPNQIRNKIAEKNIYTELQWFKLGYKPKRKKAAAIKQAYEDLEYYRTEYYKLSNKLTDTEVDRDYYKRKFERLEPLKYFKKLYLEQQKQQLQNIEKTTAKDIEYIVLDTETTGLDSGYHEILSLSIVDNMGNVLFNSLFNVFAKSWEDAQFVNGISPSMVRDKRYIYEYAAEIQTILSRAKGVVCYNAGFDLSFLGNIGFITPRLLCDVMLDFAEIYGAYNDYWGNYTWQKLTTCASYYNFNWDNLKAHNSLADTLATLYCYESMIGNTNRAEQLQDKFKDIPTPTPTMIMTK